MLVGYVTQTAIQINKCIRLLLLIQKTLQTYEILNCNIKEIIELLKPNNAAIEVCNPMEEESRERKVSLLRSLKT